MRLSRMGMVGVLSIIGLLAGCQSHLPKQPLHYRIMTMKYGENRQVAYQKSCQQFRLSPADAVQFFRHAQVVNPTLFARYARPAACFYRGTLMMDGDIQQWMITAAGVGYLSRGLNNREQRHFLCTQACTQYFQTRMPHYTLP